jgi:hypothetical protein
VHDLFSKNASMVSRRKKLPIELDRANPLRHMSVKVGQRGRVYAARRFMRIFNDLVPQFVQQRQRFN